MRGPPAPVARDRRAAILDAALDLMSEHGSADTSMRRLADACGLNVASLYHYFPSKSDLLRSVIEERGYFALLAETAEDAILFDACLPLEERLVDFLTFLSAVALAEEAPVRLLLGEGLRREPTAAATVTELFAAIELAVARWLAEGFPDLAGDRAHQGRTIRRLLLARLVEVLAGTPGAVEDHRAWAREMAPLLLGE